ncbi:hypothetical protein CEUSTIGMA_g8801.t1 [Chlamydomonas eustigma]|uniref:Phosphatidate cytidylyltransferase n=1 Tax=Chlamydomonas eustigma TaxID=1157962 RepID=A0A250XF12_9CHLO|nr:hypothetical protein CEUSTIGMA_g8801.t1 [Chlamydomonas eustigma]|eukprot:GAX81370.1 hypothetical protein CEUSTIGMA_g8801.t1 [Chlamydomonas eustigma]
MLLGTSRCIRSLIYESVQPPRSCQRRYISTLGSPYRRLGSLSQTTTSCLKNSHLKDESLSNSPCNDQAAGTASQATTTSSPDSSASSSSSQVITSESNRNKENGFLREPSPEPSHGFVHPTQSWGSSMDEDLNASSSCRKDKASSSSIAGTSESEQPKPKQSGGLAKRVSFGVLMGIVGGAAVVVKPLFLIAATFISYQATIEYYSMVTSKGITKGMPPPPPLISSLTTVLCVSMVFFSYFFRGKSGTVLAVAAFFLLVMNLVAIRKPTFSMLASTLFGVFYCGWLPSFWVKVRLLPMSAPDIPLLPAIFAPFSGWTVGLLATFTAAACVVAADTGAYFVGKKLGRTKLTEISPKKTVEGALGGLISSISVAVGLWGLTQWPATPLGAAGLGVFTFFASLFGDLIESIIKRDAGMKDSGDLIPGHGGLLDRFDSYMFTGAVTYFYIVFVLPVLPYVGS